MSFDPLDDELRELIDDEQFRKLGELKVELVHLVDESLATCTDDQLRAAIAVSPFQQVRERMQAELDRRGRDAAP